MSDFPPKGPGETATFSFGFAAALAIGETIVSAVITIAVVTRSDPSAAAMIIGSAQISGSQVLQLIANGVAGVEYELLCTITTSLGQTLQLAGNLLIQTP